MKNNIFKKTVAAIAAAAMMTTAVPAMNASAYSSATYSTTARYYSFVTGLYYTDRFEALTASKNDNTMVYDGYLNNGYYTKSTSTPYYSTYTKRYYPTYELALNASRGVVNDVISYVTSDSRDVNHSVFYSAKLPYYSTVTGYYYATLEEALSVSGGQRADVLYIPGSNYYYSSYTGLYYTSLANALYYSNYDVKYVSPLGYTTPYMTVYQYNGNNYATLADAIAAGGKQGVNITEYKYYYNNPSYYYNQFYGYYGYYNPAYYSYNYYYNTYLNQNTFDSYKYKVAAVATTKGDKTPHIYGAQSKGGWAYISRVIANANRKSTITIDMNGAFEVDASAIKAVRGRNVNLKLVYENGAVWDINGRDVTATDSVDLQINYASEFIPDALIKKASEGALTCAQIGIGSKGGSLGVKGLVTVKFNKSRAGSFAKVYIYNEEANNLTAVAKTMVDDNGYVSFDCANGGAYLIVLS